ncbi:MAG: PIG-L deacetylase family protein [Caulobacteraceae bacterium]
MNLIDQRILVFSPHQDDETIGCGGIIQKFIANKSMVKVVYATKVGETFVKYNGFLSEYEKYTGSKRMRETFEALNCLGINPANTCFLFEDKYHNNLDQIPRSVLVEGIEQQITEFKPSMVFLPALSTNQDHEVLNKCVMSATRPHFYSGSVIEYEVTNEVDFRPNLFIKLTKEEVTRKLKALEAYSSQERGALHKVSIDAIYNRAKSRGYDVFTEYAEAFFIKRFSV